MAGRTGVPSVPTYIKEVTTMMVNPKTAVFVLEVIGAVATALAGVVAKHYLDSPDK